MLKSLDQGLFYDREGFSGSNRHRVIKTKTAIDLSVMKMPISGVGTSHIFLLAKFSGRHNPAENRKK